MLARRDLSIDLVRVVCVLMVVVLHSLMVGLTATAAGGVAWTNPLERQSWFPVLSWFGQIMPLFFIVGGLATWNGLASNRRRGGTAADFVRARVLRLGVPAAVWFVVIGAALWACVGLGLPVGLLQALAGGIGMPLWFLAAYLICQAIAPLTARLHETHRVATPLLLLAGTAVVDAVRFTSGITWLGLANLLLVWPLMQQVGYFLADGTLGRLPRWGVVAGTVASFGLVGVLGTTGPWSPDMLTDLNPPTLPLVLIGTGQLGLFLLLKPALEALMRRRAAQGAVFLLGSRLMTIYLWHLLIVILVCAAGLVLPDVLAPARSAAWWWQRIPAIAVEFAVILALTTVFARFERLPRIDRVGPAPRPALLAVAVVLATVPPFWAMQFRLDLFGMVWGSVMLAAAVGIAANGRPRAAATVPPGRRGAGALLP